MADDDSKDDTSLRSPHPYQLTVQNQPPIFVFLGEPFTIDFLVVVAEDPNDGPTINSSTTLIPSFDILV